MPKFVSFVCQKGGVGKSTLTKITAAYFNERSVKTLVIDSDYPQHSLAKQRNQDLLGLSKSGSDMPSDVELEKWGINPYAIINSDVRSTISQMDILRSSGEYKFVFIDLPGTLNIDGISKVIQNLDTIIVPCELEANNIGAAMETVKAIRKFNKTVPIGFLWSRPDKIHSVKDREAVEAIIKKRIDVYFFEYIAYKNKSFNTANTLNPSPKIVYPFISELANFMNSLEPVH